MPADPRRQRPRRAAPQVARRYPVAVLPRHGLDSRPRRLADGRGRGPQALVGTGLERAVVNEGDLHRAAESCRPGSNQASLSENAATSPMMSIAGASTFSRSARAAIVPSVPMIVRCSWVVADWTIAAGVDAGSPPASRRLAMFGRFLTPM